MKEVSSRSIAHQTIQQPNKTSPLQGNVISADARGKLFLLTSSGSRRKKINLKRQVDSRSISALEGVIPVQIAGNRSVREQRDETREGQKGNGNKNLWEGWM